jgi:nucleoside-diphosphate-sugar epimerase
VGRRRCRHDGGCLDAQGIRGVVLVSSVVYGDGAGGIPSLLLASPRDDDGNLIMLGTGAQHWSTVHVADLANVFLRILESDSAHGRYISGDGLNSTVAELTEAADVSVGAPGAVSGSDDEARARLGDYFAEVLLLDQRADPGSIGDPHIRVSSKNSAAGVTVRPRRRTCTRDRPLPIRHVGLLGGAG